MSALWPDRAERALLGPFYGALLVGEALNVVFPFHFVYLLLVLERPEWAVVPLAVQALVVLALEVPTGALADRWSRKGSVLLGGALQVAALGALPWAAASGRGQLLATSIAFAVSGIGAALVSGAEDAWVVDNLVAAGREDLRETWFARAQALGGLGGVVASLLSVWILMSTEVSRGLLDLLWYVAALGFGGALALLSRAPEVRPARGDGADLRPLREGLRAVIGRRALRWLVVGLLIAALGGQVLDEGLDLSLLTKGLDARWLAPLGVLDAALGAVGPLLGLSLARRLGVGVVLVGLLAAQAGLGLLFLLTPGLVATLGLRLALDLLDDAWAPVADAELHALTPSAQRATVGSLVNQGAGLSGLAGLALFGGLLGAQGEALRDAIPDAVEAFSGGVETLPAVPLALGLPVTDLALALFLALLAAATPAVLASRRALAVEAS